MEWISIKKRMPKNGSWVLCVIFTNGKFHIPFVTQYHGKKYFRDIEEEHEVNSYDSIVNDYSHLITHWMELPELPSL